MTFLDFALTLRWFGALWLLGWLVLPLSRRIFPRLPDAGLSAGRVLFLLFATLLCFWGASLHAVSLTFAPVVFLLLALACAIGWRDAKVREFVRANRRALIVSDVVFALTWTFFLWIRLCRPEVNDLEKPMDMALISASMRTQWLPFQNPWYSGTAFTNYYYFGHLMGGLLAKSLFTAPHLAYNLIQPTFCALFLSVLWSVGATLSASLWGGTGVMLLVGLGGHFEPLRQIAQSQQLWPLDWWKTSRVIENTINEYPAFTLGSGDLHGHFFALSLAVLWFSLLIHLFEVSLRRYCFVLLLCGLPLGAWLMTNTWDVPLFTLLFLAVVSVTTKLSQSAATSRRRLVAFACALATLLIAVVASRPYFVLFKSQVSGAVFEPWRPDWLSFFLLWGGWWALGGLAWLLPPVPENEESLRRANLRYLLIGVGLLALVAPYVFYIKGYFGEGNLRHQDTVFKFGLQAWLLLGTGIASELFARLSARWRDIALSSKLWLVPLGATLAVVLAIAPFTVFFTRAHILSTGSWSLNGMRFLPQAEQSAIIWFQTQDPADSVVLENVPLQGATPIGDYDPTCGRIATFSGLSTPLGWPQHVWMWGAKYEDVVQRGQHVANYYAMQDFASAKREFGNRYVFWGNRDGILTPENRRILKPQIFTGADGSQAAIGVVD